MIVNIYIRPDYVNHVDLHNQRHAHQCRLINHSTLVIVDIILLQIFKDKHDEFTQIIHTVVYTISSATNNSTVSNFCYAQTRKHVKRKFHWSILTNLFPATAGQGS